MSTDLIFIPLALSNWIIHCVLWITCLSSIASAQDDGLKADGLPGRDNGTSQRIIDEPLIFGTVDDQDGLPVSNAAVWLVGGKYGAPELLAETTTDGDGKFAFLDLVDEETLFMNPRALEVWARHSTAGLGWFSGLYNHQRKPLSIGLAPTATFSGQLIGPAGQPLAGVKIAPRFLGASRYGQNAVRSGSFHPELRERLSATTNEKGEFRIEDLPLDGVVNCDVAAPDFEELSVNWNLNKSLVIKLDPGGSFSGRVIWPDEVRIPPEEDFKFGTVKLEGGLRFQADGSVASDERGVVYGTSNKYSIEIDKGGHFRLDHLAPGRYYVSAELSPQLPLLLTDSGYLEIKPGAGVDDFKLATEKAFRVSGRVIGFESREPIANAIVQIFQRVPGGVIPNQRITTDENGKYSAFTRPGKITLKVAEAPAEYIPGAESYDSEFALSRNPVIDVTGDTVCPDLELDSACDVVLEVFDENGKPAVGAIVKIATMAGYLAGKDYQTEQRTDAEGKYVARRVTVNDTLPVCVRTPTAISEPNFVVTPGELDGPVRIDLSPDHGFRCRCLVVDREGEPIANARVSVTTYYSYISKWSDPERGLAISGSAGAGVTNPDGYFETGPLWPDRHYRMTVEADGYDLSETPRIKGKKGEVFDLKPIVLSAVKATKIVGVVVDSNKLPVENVRVFAAGNSYLLATAQTDSSGRFELNELAADVRYVFADGGANYRFGGTRLGNQQPLEVTIRSVDSPPQGVRENRLLPREEQLTAANELIEQIWSLPENVSIGSQLELLQAMVQIDPARAMEKALATGRGYESFVLAEQALREFEDDPVRALHLLQTVRNRVGILTARTLGVRLAKSGSEQDKRTALEFAELALKLTGGSTAYQSRLAPLFTSLGQHEKAQSLIADVLKPIDLDNPTEEQQSILISLAPAVAPYDFARAQSLASLAKEGASRTYAQADVAVALVGTDYEKAIREIEALTGDANAPNIRDKSRLRLALSLIETHPDVAIKLVHQCEQEGNRAQALGRLAARVAEFDQPQAWKMIDTALAIHRNYPDAFRSWSNYGGAGTFAAGLAWHAQQAGYPDMESVVWHVLAACRATDDQGQDRFEATVKTARVLALVDKIAARDLLNAVADKVDQFPRDRGSDSLYEQWLQAWLLVDFGRGTRLLGDELEELKNTGEKSRLNYNHGSVFRLLVAPREEQYQLLLRETGLWKLEEDETIDIR